LITEQIVFHHVSGKGYGMKLAKILLTVGLGFWMSAVQSAPVEHNRSMPPSESPDQGSLDIVSIAKDDLRLTTLVKALEAADLLDTLGGAGPFTVFAPTDEAFNKLGAETIEALLADKEKLSSILLYHVVPNAAVDFTAASQLTEAQTVNGRPLRITFEDGLLRINDALVVVMDIKASNGIIHIIDTVLIPEQR
jgi:uncharacterized surface protein with fasciclin (FAS1) repeats